MNATPTHARKLQGPRREAENYERFLSSKSALVPQYGFKADVTSTHLFPFQRAIVEWAIDRGRAAIFADTGLGKTRMQLAWANAVALHTDRPVLVLAPLSVARQTAREGDAIGIGVTVCREPCDVRDGVCITNYDRFERFDPSLFGGVVLDESSILKSFMGSTKRALVEAFARTPYRLACTATPAPNDHMELGNHSEFLGILSGSQMLTRWFINDTSAFGTYRLKGHAVGPFWDWVGSWARCVSLPSDIGPYSDDGYILPELRIVRHDVSVDVTADRGDSLFRSPELSATQFHKERRRTADARARRLAELVASEPKEPWIVWADTDYDADAVLEHLRPVVPDVLDVRGSMKTEQKEDGLDAFSSGAARVLVTKPSIAGFGLNWQHCARAAFVGPSFSYEAFYQAVRRCWRFGQSRPVDVHVTIATTEADVWATVMRKADAHDEMRVHMMAASRRAQQRVASMRGYEPAAQCPLPSWLEGGLGE